MSESEQTEHVVPATPVVPAGRPTQPGHPWSGSLYGLVWRRLPGRWPAKVALLGVVAAVVVALLFSVVFPWVEPRLPVNQVTVDRGSGGG